MEGEKWSPTMGPKMEAVKRARLSSSHFYRRFFVFALIAYVVMRGLEMRRISNA
jgi:hypothetical protein